MELKEYLPLFFREIREYGALMDSQQPEFVSLKDAIEATENNEFIMTLDENGCARWESMLNISSMSTATLEDRRFVIASKYRESLPYTWLALIARLDSTLGSGNYLITEDRETYTLTLKILLTRKQQKNEVISMMENLVPCNIILNIDLLYNRHITLHAFTHAELSAYTHHDLREEVLS